MISERNPFRQLPRRMGCVSRFTFILADQLQQRSIANKFAHLPFLVLIAKLHVRFNSILILQLLTSQQSVTGFFGDYLSIESAGPTTTTTLSFPSVFILFHRFPSAGALEINGLLAAVGREEAATTRKRTKKNTLQTSECGFDNQLKRANSREKHINGRCVQGRKRKKEK